MLGTDSDRSDRQCVFCEGAIASADPPEHVIPKWMRRFRPKGGWFKGGPGVVLVGEAKNPQPDRPFHPHKEPDVTTPAVCRACNHEWMSDLETWASQTIDPMIRRDEQQTLSIEDQAWLAVWGIKTAMMWMLVPPGEPLIPFENYRWLRAHKLPPPGFRVRIGRYEATGTRLPWSFFVPSLLGDAGNPGPAPTDIHKSVMTFGHLVFDIAGPVTVGGREPPPLDNGTFMLDIWPRESPGPVSWPPTHTHEGDEIFRLMDVSPETDLPNPGAQ